MEEKRLNLKKELNSAEKFNYGERTKRVPPKNNTAILIIIWARALVFTILMEVTTPSEKYRTVVKINYFRCSRWLFRIVQVVVQLGIVRGHVANGKGGEDW